jgi:hypothetical protein
MCSDKKTILKVLSSPDTVRSSEKTSTPSAQRQAIMEKLVDQLFIKGKLSTDQVFQAWEANTLLWLDTQGEVGKKLYQAFSAFSREEKIELFAGEPNSFEDFLAMVKMAEAMINKR